MAITFRGLIKTLPIFGNDSTIQNLCTFENPSDSRVNIIIRRLVLQNDNLTTNTNIMPLVKVSRATSISGGVILEQGSFDTNTTSTKKLIVRAQQFETGVITATAGTTIWQQFISRLHTGAEQQQGIENNLLPMIVANTGKEFRLRPGEALLVQLNAINTAANSVLMNNIFIQGVFEEDTITTFAISGTVTLSGAPVSGAKVMVIEADDESMTNPVLVEVITTGGSGTWASSIRTGKVGAAFVQYKNGATYYTAPGSPFLS